MNSDTVENSWESYYFLPQEAKTSERAMVAGRSI